MARTNLASCPPPSPSLPLGENQPPPCSSFSCFLQILQVLQAAQATFPAVLQTPQATYRVFAAFLLFPFVLCPLPHLPPSDFPNRTRSSTVSPVARMASTTRPSARSNLVSNTVKPVATFPSPSIWITPLPAFHLRLACVIPLLRLRSSLLADLCQDLVIADSG
jgi:hypothetical protein